VTDFTRIATPGVGAAADPKGGGDPGSDRDDSYVVDATGSAEPGLSLAGGTDVVNNHCRQSGPGRE
jgi:hypothetical protein